VVAVVVAIVVAVGLDSARRLPIDAVPDITNVQVQVLGTAPALGPLDVETTITAPIEAALGGLPGVSEVRSLSRAGLAAITVVFDDDTDLLLARQLVNERVTAVRNDLDPAGRNGVDVELGPLSTGLGEVLQFEVTSTAKHSLMELRGVLDATIAPELRTVRGVAEVNAFGGEWLTWEVELDAAKLRAAGVDVGDVYRALEREHGTAGGGSIARAGEQWLVRGDARFNSLDDVGDVVVVRAGRSPVQLVDLGRVREAPLLRHGAVTRDGRGEAVTGIVMMLVGENGGDVVARVKERLTTLQAALPKGVGIDVFYDRSTLVQRTIRTVATNLIEGAVFVVLVLFVLLGSFRAGVVVAIAIPLSMLVAFIGMRALGLSGNLMSLGALDFGIVVDGSVIVVEAALVALAAARVKKGRALRYADASDVVVDVSWQLSRSTVYGGLILALVYVPVLTLSGVEGRMFKPMALAVLFALLGAIVVSLTVVPVLTAWLLRGSNDVDNDVDNNVDGSGDDAPHEPKVVGWLRRAYTPVLDAAVASPGRVVVVAVVAVVVAVVLLTRLGGAFMPRLDEGAIAVQLMRLPSVSLPESIAGATRFEQLAKAQNDVDTVICKTGRAEIATDPMGIELSDCLVMLVPGTSTARAAGIVSALQTSSSSALPDLGLAFSQPIELRMAELISGSRA
ncbi:MAG TPA: efflux RND transporter permease subunit, partial [Myxococcota bacterium]